MNNPAIRAYIITSLERLRTLNRSWEDVELLEKLHSSHSFDNEAVFKGSSENEKIYKNLINNSLVVFEHQETMFAYLTMTGFYEEHMLSDVLIKPIKSWEEVKMQMDAEGLLNKCQSDRLNEQDMDCDLFFKTIMVKDTWSQGQLKFDTPSEFIEHLQLSLVDYPIFTLQMFIPPPLPPKTDFRITAPVLNSDACKLLINALGDITPSGKALKNSRVQATVFLNMAEDPVVKYLIETLCISTPRYHDDVISIELFRRMHDCGQLDSLIGACRYPIVNRKISVKQMDGLTPTYFRQRYNFEINSHQQNMDYELKTVQNTRNIWNHKS